MGDIPFKIIYPPPRNQLGEIDGAYYKTSLRLAPLLLKSALKRFDMHTTGEKKLYNEWEEYFVSELARYELEYQRLNDENKMYREKEDYLLSEISRIVSNHSSTEADLMRLEEDIKEPQGSANFQEFLHLVEEKEELEERLRSLIEVIISIQRSKTTLGEDRTELISELHNHKEEHEKLKAEYEDAICERDGLAAEVNILAHELAHCDEDARRTFVQVAEMKKRDNDLVQEIEMVRDQKGKEVRDLILLVVGLFIVLFLVFGIIVIHGFAKLLH